MYEHLYIFISGSSWPIGRVFGFKCLGGVIKRLGRVCVCGCVCVCVWGGVGSAFALAEGYVCRCVL